nr:hypothetical protein [Tanacetum cinerariifolium]
MLVPQGEGSGTPTEPHHTPSLEAQHTSPTTHSLPTLPSVTTAPIPTVTPYDTPLLRQYTRRARIAQSSDLPPVEDKLASPLRDVSQGEACLTVSSLDAEQERENIANTSTLPHELTSRARVKLLEDGEGGGADRSADDALIKGRRLDEGEEVAEKGSNDTEEMINVLTSMDAATVLSSGVAEVPTSSGSILTAGPPAAEVPTGSDVVPTAGLIFATATVMARQLEEEMEREAQRINEQIARDAEIARIHTEEEPQIMIDGLDRSNEIVAKYLQEYHQFATELPIERRIELISDLVRYQDNYAKIEGFIPIGLKEETERFKRKGLRLEQESLNIRPVSSDKEIELWVELKRLYEPDVEDQLWTHTQNMMHALVEWKPYDSCRVHHVTSKDNEIFMLIEKDYPLRKGLAIVMINYKLQIENYSQMASDLILKIYKIANHLRQEDD